MSIRPSVVDLAVPPPDRSSLNLVTRHYFSWAVAHWRLEVNGEAVKRPKPRLKLPYFTCSSGSCQALTRKHVKLSQL